MVEGGDLNLRRFYNKYLEGNNWATHTILLADNFDLLTNRCLGNKKIMLLKLLHN